MQPPPRKGNYTKFLKNLHSEQLSKLQLKNQHECELLEDIRNFTIKKSAVEKSYSEALLKISSAYLNKKMPNIPDIKLDGGEERWNMWNVWRTVLEENEKLARARLAAVEVFQQQIADEAKVLRQHKLQMSKKTIDQLAVIQKELQTCVQEVDKTKKLYFDEEHSAHDVRDKAKDIEEKLKKKKGSFFQSITSLQKNSAKFSSKREQLEEKSSGARNDYLLSLAAANAHQTRYFAVDLQMALQIMESSVFDKVSEYLTLMGRTELLTCSATQNSYTKVRDQAQQITRDYNLKCCYLFYPVLKQHIQYEFEPCDNDPIDHITADHESAAAQLSKEARRWASRIARENNNIRECVRKLQIYNALRESGQKVDPNDPNGPDLETRIDEMKQAIRRSETAKMKAEARIECLRAGGVNVDEWMQEAETLSVQDIPRSASSLSMRTDASGTGEQPSSDSFYDSDFADGETAPVGEKADSVEAEETQDTSYDTAEVDAMLEQERQRIEQLTAGWDDPTQVDWGNVEDHTGDEQRAEEVKSVPGLKCTALYSYTAQNPDELSIVENEQLEVIGEGDGDGWVRARNYRGEEGFVPHNYLDVDRETSSQTPGLQTQISFSSVDYTVDEQDEEGLPGEQTDQTQSPEQVSVISVPIQKPEEEQVVSYCVALYDYEAAGPDELSFEECDIIKVLNKCAHGVDDGWWEGEIDGRRGNFPSLVVEECDEFGEPLTNQWEETPPCSAPPVFTPPDVPNFLLQPQTEVIVTQPTPVGEQGDQQEQPDKTEEAPTDQKSTGGPPSVPPPTAPPSVPPPAPPKPQGFQMELTRNQQQQYTTQFGFEEEEINERHKKPKKPTDIPCVTVEPETGPEAGGESEKQKDEDFGLGVAQIVITAATPMMEEPEQPFPPPPPPEQKTEPTTNGTKDEDEDLTSADPLTEIPEEEEASTEDVNKMEQKEEIEEDKSVADDQPTDSAPFPTSSSTGSGGDSTGPSTAENSQSLPVTTTASTTSSQPPPQNDPEILNEDDIPKQVVGGRASIPDELEPHQLAQLQDLKESNA